MGVVLDKQVDEDVSAECDEVGAGVLVMVVGFQASWLLQSLQFECFVCCQPAQLAFMLDVKELVYIIFGMGCYALPYGEGDIGRCRPESILAKIVLARTQHLEKYLVGRKPRNPFDYRFAWSARTLPTSPGKL